MVAATGSFRFAVIGGGPAGLAAVGRLLDSGKGPVLWIDKTFESGRLSTYAQVPRYEITLNARLTVQ